MELQRKTPPIIQAAAWMLGTLLSFSLMAIAVRELSPEISTFQMLTVRSAIGLVIVMILLHRTGWGQITGRHLKLHLARNVVHLVGHLGWLYAIAFLPLATVFSIEFTVPLWTALLATAFLGEQLNATRIAAILLGLSGVLVILRPGTESIHPAALGMLGGALAYSIAYIVTRKLAADVSPLSILFYMMGIQFLLSLAPCLTMWVDPTPVQWTWLTIIGLTVLSGHYCVTKALQLAEATVIVPMDFVRLPLIAVVGALFYGEQPDVFLVAGALLIIVANSVNIHRERAEAMRPCPFEK